MPGRSLWCVVLLCACGPKGDGDTGDTGDSSGSSSPSVDTSTTSEPTTSEPSTTGDPLTAGDTVDTGVDLCEDPTVPVGPGVQISISNASAGLAFVDFEIGCHLVQPFKVLDADAVQLKVDLGVFEFACSEGPGACGRDPAVW